MPPPAPTRAVLAAVALLAACGGSRDAPPPREATPGLAAADPARPVDAAPPPLRPLDGAALDDLATVEVPDFEVVHRDRTATSLVVSLRDPAASLRGLVTVAPCLRCRPMSAAAWTEAVPELRLLLPGAVEDDPATRFELGEVTVAGRRCIATWELGAISYDDDLDATHGARIYCNDGVTELVIRVDDEAIVRAANAEAAREGASRQAVEGAAQALAAAFLEKLAAR